MDKGEGEVGVDEQVGGQRQEKNRRQKSVR